MFDSSNTDSAFSIRSNDDVVVVDVVVVVVVFETDFAILIGSGFEIRIWTDCAKCSSSTEVDPTSDPLIRLSRLILLIQLNRMIQLIRWIRREENVPTNCRLVWPSVQQKHKPLVNNIDINTNTYTNTKINVNVNLNKINGHLFNNNKNRRESKVRALFK